MALDSLGLLLCDIHGRLFEYSAKMGCASKAFVEAFMCGPTAAALDKPYDRTQWMGEEYLFEEIDDEAGGLPRGGDALPSETLFWMGFIYRFWHLYTGESSSVIYATADVAVMASAYPGFHTLDNEMAVDRLRGMRGKL